MADKEHFTLEEVQKQFEQWRRGRKHREKIPAALWAAAVSLTASHSIFKTAKALRLSYNALKKRANKGAVTEASNKNTFIEFKPGPLPPATECVIEIEKPAAKMRISFKGGPDIFELVKSFWGV